jgi:hypothetical protein
MTNHEKAFYPESEEPPAVGFPSHAVLTDNMAELVARSPAQDWQKGLIRSMLHDAPTPLGRMSVAWAVHELPRGEEDVGRLADYFWANIIKPGAHASS